MHTQSKMVTHERLRPVNWEQDLDAVLQIERQSFRRPWSRQRFCDFNSRSNSFAVVAVHGESIVGFMLYELHPSRLHIAHIAVAQDFRDQGIGSEMLLYLCQQMRTSGVTCTLNVRVSNEAAQRLYGRIGFSIGATLHRHYADGEDALVMHYPEAEENALKNKVKN